MRIGGRLRVGFPPFSDPNDDLDPTLNPNHGKGNDTNTTGERPGFKDATVGVSSLLDEETRKCWQARTTVSSGPSGAALSMGRTNATSDTYHA